MGRLFPPSPLRFAKSFDRYIPTLVGRFMKTWDQNCFGDMAVHPHACGEIVQGVDRQVSSGFYGTSPRLWGDSSMWSIHHHVVQSRYIPTLVGRLFPSLSIKVPRRKPRYIPTLVGRLPGRFSQTRIATKRYIPTLVGRFFCTSTIDPAHLSNGTSPRLWGD